MMSEAADQMLRDGPEAERAAVDVAAEMMHVALQIVGKAMFSARSGTRRTNWRPRR